MSTSRIPHVSVPRRMASFPRPQEDVSQLSPKLSSLVRSEAFRNWFGDWQANPNHASQAVNVNGEPLLVYHGTAHSFEQFNMQRIGQRTRTTFNSSGIYFTDDIRVARTYGPRIIKAFLNLRRPYINTFPSRWMCVQLDNGNELTQIPAYYQQGYVIWPSDIPPPPEGTVNGQTSDGAYTSYRLPYRTTASVDQIATWARQSAFDGLLLCNMHDQGHPVPDGDDTDRTGRIRATTLTVFDPEQVWIVDDLSSDQA